MVWEYRVVAKKWGIPLKAPTLWGYSYSIKEVYFPEDYPLWRIDTHLPDDPSRLSWTEDSIYPAGDTLEEVREDLKRMLRATELPVLEEYDDSKDSYLRAFVSEDDVNQASIDSLLSHPSSKLDEMEEAARKAHREGKTRPFPPPKED